MSRELLKRVITECSDEGSRSNITPKLYGAIAEYLEMPEPEPVAWMVENHPEELDTFVNFTPNFNSQFEKLCCKVTPLYTTPPDQSARIAALKHELQQADEDYVSVEHELQQADEDYVSVKEAYLQCQKDLYDETEKLAALQAKREPLSSELLTEMAQQANKAINPYYEFARAIEAAHGIGVNHE